MRYTSGTRALLSMGRGPSGGARAFEPQLSLELSPAVVPPRDAGDPGGRQARLCGVPPNPGNLGPALRLPWSSLQRSRWRGPGEEEGVTGGRGGLGLPVTTRPIHRQRPQLNPGIRGQRKPTSPQSPKCFWVGSSENIRSPQLPHSPSISSGCSLKAWLAHTSRFSFS